MNKVLQSAMDAVADIQDGPASQGNKEPHDRE